MAEFRMPSLGADMASGTLVQWLVQPGDHVDRGDIVAVVETQKGAIDVEIFDSGTVTSLLVEEGTDVPVGAVLAIVNGAGAVPPEESTEVATSSVAPTAAEAPIAPSIEVDRIRVSPLARRRASELGVTLERVKGTGPGGAITVGDIEAASQAGAEPAPAIDRSASIRAAIASAMSIANRDIPHYYLATDIDMSRALAWLEERNRDRSVTERILYAAPLLKAVARAAQDIPEVNGWYVDGAFQQNENINIGVAISLRGGGLVAPAIHRVDALSVDETMEKLSDLISRARSGRLRSSEVSEPTITVTNLGEQGVPTVFGVIYPPQVALVGFGKIVQRPWVTETGIESRPVLTATLSADHRVSDGHRGGLFLAAIEKYMQEPGAL